MRKSNILLFAILMLAFAMSVKAYDIEKMDSTNLDNRTIIGGTSTGSTGVFTFDMRLNDGNFTVRLLSNATGVSTWTTITMEGIVGNSTCYANSTCRKGGTGNAGDSFKTTVTLPSDKRHVYTKLEVNGTTNGTHILTFDSTGPTLTFVDPTPAMNAREDDGSWTMNMTTGENVTSCTFTRQPNTVVTTATLAASDQAGWVSYSSMAAARYSFSGTCLDYASDGANSGSTSENRIIQKASDPSPVTEEILGTTGTTFASKKKVLIVFAVVFVILVCVLLLVMAMNGKSRRKRRR